MKETGKVMKTGIYFKDNIVSINSSLKLKKS